mmetsp:Transcript_26840/g.37179  ORF Transcript_26840/g.37179 Transcript_26840/m.37179 type:complete len:237 (+) Transcript_26840:530-1240(+)
MLLDVILESIRESEVGPLALLVPVPLVHCCIIPLALGILRPFLLKAVSSKLFIRGIPCSTRMRNYSGISRLLGSLVKDVKQQGGQQEMREMVRLHLEIITILSAFITLRHEPGIQDKAIEAPGILLQVFLDFLCGRADALEVAKVACGRDNTPSLFRFLGQFGDSLERLRRVLALPVEEDQVPTLLRNVLGENETNATAGARDSVGLALERARHLLSPDFGCELCLWLRLARDSEH